MKNLQMSIPVIFHLNFTEDMFQLCEMQFTSAKVKTRSQVYHERRHEKFIEYMTYSMFNGYCDCILCIAGFIGKGTTKICSSTKRKLFA